MEQQLFRNLFAVIRDDDPESVFTIIENIMYVLLDGREDISEELLHILLSKLGPSIKGVSEAAKKLAMNVIERCAAKLEPVIKKFLVSSMSEDGPSNRRIDYHGVIYDLYRCSPQILSGVIPYITGELRNDQSEVRNRVVNLVGMLFAIPGSVIPEAFQPIFVEFLKRLTDRDVVVRMTVLDFVEKCFLSNPSRPEAAQIFAALSDRFLDDDENVRKQVVAFVCDVAGFNLDSVPIETRNLIANRLNDRLVPLETLTVEIEGKERLDAYMGPGLNRESRDASERADGGNMEVSTDATNNDESTEKNRYQQSKHDLDDWEEDGDDIYTPRFESSRDVLASSEQCNRLSRNASMNSGTRRGQPPLQFGPPGSMLAAPIGTGMVYRGMSPQICGVGGQDMQLDGRNIYESGTLSVPLPQRSSSDGPIPPVQPSSTQMGGTRKGIMVPPDRAVRRKVMNSKRRRQDLGAPPRSRSRGIYISPTPDPITSEDFPSVLLREVEADFEKHVNDDDHFDDEDVEEQEQQGGVDDRFLENHTTESHILRGVVRDSKGRYVRCSEGSSHILRREVRDSKGRWCSEGSSSTGCKKTKKDLSWRLKSPVLGGPTHLNVLRSFGGHVAFTSWTQPDKDKVRLRLKCYERPSCLEAMNDIKLSKVVSRGVSDSGLGHLRHCMTTGLDENLISAFVERWQPDTNTFHMPFGEISIMLHDVHRILGIRVNGRRVFVDGMVEEEEEGSTREDEGLKAKVATFLGVDIVSVAPPIYKGGGLLTKSLKRVVESGNHHDSLRAYMMMLFGQTLFMDKSGDRVIARMLPLFDDLDDIGEYAWGAATLAYLYRQLGMASRLGARGLSGCLPLLQAWIYEYFPHFRPHVGYYVEGRPLVEAWSQVPRFKGEFSLLEQHRQRLDGLRAEHVTWTPYGHRPDRTCRTSLYSGLIRFLDIVEPYQPDRCMRQFGYCQTIPMPMLIPAIDHRPALPKSGYRVYYGDFPDVQWGLDEARIVLYELSRPAVMPFETVPRYMVWYEKCSHPYFYPPTLRTQFLRRPIWEEPEVARAITHKFSLIYRQPTPEARNMYIGRLVREMADYFRTKDDDDISYHRVRRH